MFEESWHYCRWCEINYARSTSDAHAKSFYCCVQCEGYHKPLPTEGPEAAFLRGQQVMRDFIVKTTMAIALEKEHIKLTPFTPYTPPTR